MNASSIVQIVKTWRTKNVVGLSMPAYWVTLAGFAVAIAYCIISASTGWLLANYLIGFVLTLVEISLIWFCSEPFVTPR